MITWLDVVEKLPAPELASFPEPAQDSILAFVAETVSASAFGGEGSARLQRARMLLAAHMATVTPGGSVATGPVVSQSEGRVSRTYATSDVGAWSGSSYGQEYARLVRSSPGCRLPRTF